MSIRRSVVVVLAIAVCANVLLAHPGHEHAPRLRNWKSLDGQLDARASFVAARDGVVQLRDGDGKLLAIAQERLRPEDQAWVARRLDEIRQLNDAPPAGVPAAARRTEPRSVAQNNSLVPAHLLSACVLVAIVVLGRSPRHKRSIAFVGLCLFGIALFGLTAGCGKTDKHPQRKHDPAEIEKHFAHFNDVTFRADADYFYIESRAFPDHPLMIGITAWQQQVPLPQPYSGKNAGRIPLKPVVADTPISAKKALFRGALALAVNGVPIFNALNNRGEDAYLAGELDEYGGHCGRGDDYHYHIAPVHLEKIVGKGNPIAYGLDGFPLYGYTDAAGNEPTDLDEFNGRFEKDGSYRYYATRKYPYIMGGMRGVVTVKGDQIDPQPRDAPARPAGEPLRGAKITDFVRDDVNQTYTLKYELAGKTHSVRYTINEDGTLAFTYIDGDGAEKVESYRRKEKK